MTNVGVKSSSNGRTISGDIASIMSPNSNRGRPNPQPNTSKQTVWEIHSDPQMSSFDVNMHVSH